MRGAVVGGSGAVNGGYFCRGLPADFDGWGLPGWAWADVLPHFRGHRDRPRLRRPAARLGRADPRPAGRRIRRLHSVFRAIRSARPAIGGSTISTARHPRSRCRPGVGAVPLNIDGGTRVGPGGAYLQPAMDRTNLTLLDQHPGGAHPDRRRPGGRRRVCRTRRAVDSDRRSNRVVRRRNRIRTPADAVGRRARRRCCGRRECRCWSTCRWARRVGSSGMGAAGGLAGDPRAAAAGGGADHQDGLEIRPYTAGFGAMISGRRDDPADRPHLGVALMQPRSRGRVRAGIRRPRRAARSSNTATTASPPTSPRLRRAPSWRAN